MAPKILALHGYTQSGPFFQRKIVKLQSHLENLFPGAKFYFPTGVIRLRPGEKVLDPDQRQSEPQLNNEEPHTDDIPDPNDIECYAWHKLHERQTPPTGFLDSLDALADILRKKGPFDGILGFSQGSVMAVMVASLLEGKERREAFARAELESPDNIPYPLSFHGLDHPPLQFGITYGALMGREKKYAAFYENPLVQTPFIHFCGNVDPVVESEMAQAVVDAQIGGDNCVRINHPGAHIVPVWHKYLTAVSEFILDHYSGTNDPEPALHVLEQQLTLNLPLDVVKKSMKRLRADSTSSVSGDSAPEDSSSSFRSLGTRRFKRRVPSGYRAVRRPMRAPLLDSAAEPSAGFRVEVKILPSSKESIYFLPPVRALTG